MFDLLLPIDSNFLSFRDSLDPIYLGEEFFENQHQKIIKSKANSSFESFESMPIHRFLVQFSYRLYADRFINSFSFGANK